MSQEVRVSPRPDRRGPSATSDNCQNYSSDRNTLRGHTKASSSSSTTCFVLMSITSPMHYLLPIVSRMNTVELARFRRLAKPQPNGCWLWTGPHGTSDGYGHFQPGPGQRKQMAHRWSYENLKGPIPEGQQIDHLCHTQDESCPGGRDCPHRRCVNPDHLEAVTASVNTTRQRHYARSRTECPKGHPYQGENLIRGSDGKRRCRECDRERKRVSGTAQRTPR